MFTKPSILIDGSWIDTAEYKDVLNPVNGTVVGRVAYGGAAEAKAAVDAAAAALPTWADTPARNRASLLHRAADLLLDRAEQIGVLLANETGKRKPEAVGEISFSAEYFRWFAEEVRRPAGAVLSNEATDRRHMSIRRPAGVVASLTPWNFPCSIQARKIAPALAAGCTVVARVSEQAPLAVTELFRCMTDAGFPAGTINLVHGPAAEITDSYLDHPAVRVVSFTGSTEVGQRIMEKASKRIVRPLLELGGNAPFIVFEDANVNLAVTGAMLAKFRNTGQSCIGANLFFIHAGIYDEFTRKFANAVNAMSIGDGLAPNVPDLAACINDRHVQAVNSLVNEAMVAGAKKITRKFDLPKGAFCTPALLTDVPDDVGLANEEIFGPAAAVQKFEKESDVIARANATEMGLAGYFYTRGQARIWRIAEQLDTGITGVNHPLPSVPFAPMGGTKQSGLGREGGSSGLEEFEETRYLSIGV